MPDCHGVRLSYVNPQRASANMGSNVWTQMLLNSTAGDFSESYMKEKIVSRLFASIALLAVAAGFAGCVVAPGYDYGYAQPFYYPGYGYAYGPPYAPAYATVGLWGGWGGPCCYYHGGGYWHGRGGWHGGGGHGGGYGGSRGGNSWSSAGGAGGHGH
jgi:hypothetical protein